LLLLMVSPNYSGCQMDWVIQVVKWNWLFRLSNGMDYSGCQMDWVIQVVKWNGLFRLSNGLGYSGCQMDWVIQVVKWNGLSVSVSQGTPRNMRKFLKTGTVTIIQECTYSFSFTHTFLITFNPSPISICE
jgi:hypothetical protein